MSATNNEGGVRAPQPTLRDLAGMVDRRADYQTANLSGTRRVVQIFSNLGSRIPSKMNRCAFPSFSSRDNQAIVNAALSGERLSKIFKSPASEKVRDLETVCDILLMSDVNESHKVNNEHVRQMQAVLGKTKQGAGQEVPLLKEQVLALTLLANVDGGITQEALENKLKILNNTTIADLRELPLVDLLEISRMVKKYSTELGAGHAFSKLEKNLQAVIGDKCAVQKRNQPPIEFKDYYELFKTKKLLSSYKYDSGIEFSGYNKLINKGIDSLFNGVDLTKFKKNLSSLSLDKLLELKQMVGGYKGINRDDIDGHINNAIRKNVEMNPNFNFDELSLSELSDIKDLFTDIPQSSKDGVDKLDAAIQGKNKLYGLDQ